MALHRRDPPHPGKCIRNMKLTINKNFIEVSYDLAKLHLIASVDFWQRQVVEVGHLGARVDDWDLVNLLFTKSSNDSEIVGMISSYVLYVWEMVHVKKTEVKLDKFFGYLTFKYKMHQTCTDQQLNLHCMT